MYYRQKTGQEIDFIFNGDTAMEVKETPVIQDKNILVKRANALSVKKHLLIGRFPAQYGFEDFLWGGGIF